MIIVNLKTYEEGTGSKAIEIGKMCDEILVEKGIDVAVAGQAVDLPFLAQQTVSETFAQHVDAIGYGAHTGAVLPEAVKEAGADGSLVNHSEKRLPVEQIAQIVKILKKLDLRSVVCARDDREAKKVARLKPDFVAVEPPELIGGKVSVATRPELIERSVRAVGKNLLVGAGIHTAEDVRRGLELGAKGILVSSGVVKAPNPKAVLADLASAFK